ncbi:hypothetical protein OAJ71_00765 [Nitrosopumilus sp.]|nr:hypothetical protein [Nitrosopumilus sp.]
MNKQEELMDSILNTDLEIIETVRSLQKENWNDENLKNQATDLLQIHDETITKLRSLQNDDGCGCGSDNC